jgi:hypothetical protein
MSSVDEMNVEMRAAVKERLEATPADDPKLIGYEVPGGGCCGGGRCHPKPQAHPSSQAFYDLCDRIKAIHASKSRDYGSEHDPLANIRNGAAFVGIEPWRAAMVRLSDKVTRLATFNRTGTLTHEGVEDTLVDLASYSLLTLLFYLESRREA